MKERIKTIIAVIMILILLPYVITYAIQGEAIFEFGVPAADKMDIAPTEVLIGILANEISMDYPMEAIKAQAVIVRTEYARREKLGMKPEESCTMCQLEELWGSNHLQVYYERAKKAVETTAGEVLVYEGELIQPAYHRVSAGMTRSVASLSGEATPYLQSVSCGSDMLSPDFLSVRYFSTKEIEKALQFNDSDENMCAEDLLKTFSVTTDDAGYLIFIQKDDEIISGDELRAALELPSTFFYMKAIDDKIRVVNKGLGHGIGLSQYHAMQLANENKSYDEILKYFYVGCSLQLNSKNE
ncbi:MAG: SpoIID/LytB domain-containing protein [bacterium]|nr:SpoIID/LytB domain-containing protein [bacterium]